ncbi:unnamed protein product [Closterium sp. Yama58-4]|nr:unnamed protein product [Closterium sp. Yama58-4]
METQAGRPEPSGFRSKRPRKAAQWINPLLRFLQLAAAVSAFPVMIRAGAGLLWFSNWQAFSFLIAGTVIAGFWALLMLILDCFLAASGKLLHSTALLWAIVIGDFAALSIALSAGAATANLTTLNDQGLPRRLLRRLKRPHSTTRACQDAPSSARGQHLLCSHQGIPPPCHVPLPPHRSLSLWLSLQDVPSSARGQRPSTPSVPAPKDSSFCVSTPQPLFPVSTPVLQIALSMALSAGAATAALTTLNDQGLPGRPFICTGSTPFNTFCARTKAAAAMALISAAFFLPSLLLSGARLASEYYEEED